eukprot:TRINITY_DN6035_c0_g1_i1.p1 TRINITY_DN6035_c0_g1~~TRINITY_DN6035_c0_g1_i1.p1  ORF type:complete len:712 (+),score=240.55 TRINITY_DN6035_c0_g1_i1:82-2217(+)
MGNSNTSYAHPKKPENFQRIKYEIVDVLETVEGKEEESVIVVDDDYRSTRWIKKMWSYLITEQKFFVFVILCIIGVLATLVGFFIDFSISELYNVVELSFVNITDIKIVQYLLWILYSVTFCICASLTVIFISPNAAGSGIPEIKSLMSGIHVPEYLSASTFVAKVLGIICAFAGGLSIGKEGPYVHISSIIANYILKIPIWKKIGKNEQIRFQMIAAAAAVGVSASFGAPVGGVLFSVEVTATFYLVENLWKAFWCAACGALIVKLLSELGFSVGVISLFRLNDEDWILQDYNWPELGAFAAVGIIGGIIGAAFVRSLNRIVSIQRKIEFFKGKRGHIYKAIIVAIIVAAITGPFKEVRNNQSDGIAYLFDEQEKANHEMMLLLLMFAAKFFITLVSVGLSGFPCGVYTPLFVIGAAFGRLIGEILAYLLPEFGIQPVAYSVVGASAVCASATHTISTAVIVVELTGQFRLLLPILIAVLMGDGIGKFISNSVYDALLFQKGLPFMPPYEAGSIARNITAQDVMRSIDDVEFLTETSTYYDVNNLLKKSTTLHTFPMVQDEDNMVLLGSIKRTELINLLRKVPENTPAPKEINNLPNLQQAIESHNYDYDMIQLQTIHNHSEDELELDQDSIWNQRIIFVTTQNVSEREFIENHNMVVLDPPPLQISEQTSLSKIHYIFTMLGISHVYVTVRGRLVGVITKSDLLVHLFR